MIIDAKNLLAGRLATVVAKKALLGEDIVIVNAEHACVSGTKKRVFADFMRRRRMGTWATGPFVLRQPDRMLKRTIRGMLPYKQEKGKKAFDRIKCYLGVPAEFKDKKLETIEGAQVSKLPHLKYVSYKEIATLLGAKRVVGE